MALCKYQLYVCLREQSLYTGKYSDLQFLVQNSHVN